MRTTLPSGRARGWSTLFVSAYRQPLSSRNRRRAMMYSRSVMKANGKWRSQRTTWHRSAGLPFSTTSYSVTIWSCAHVRPQSRQDL